MEPFQVRVRALAGCVEIAIGPELRDGSYPYHGAVAPHQAVTLAKILTEEAATAERHMPPAPRHRAAGTPSSDAILAMAAVIATGAGNPADDGSWIERIPLDDLLFIVERGAQATAELGRRAKNLLEQRP